LDVLQGVARADEVTREMGVIFIEELPQPRDIGVRADAIGDEAGIDSEALGPRLAADRLEERGFATADFEDLLPAKS
jgi:hypothetical protein